MTQFSARRVQQHLRTFTINSNYTNLLIIKRQGEPESVSKSNFRPYLCTFDFFRDSSSSSACFFHRNLTRIKHTRKKSRSSLAARHQICFPSEQRTSLFISSGEIFHRNHFNWIFFLAALGILKTFYLEMILRSSWLAKHFTAKLSRFNWNFYSTFNFSRDSFVTQTKTRLYFNIQRNLLVIGDYCSLLWN